MFEIEFGTFDVPFLNSNFGFADIPDDAPLAKIARMDTTKTTCFCWGLGARRHPGSFCAHTTKTTTLPPDGNDGAAGTSAGGDGTPLVAGDGAPLVTGDGAPLAAGDDASVLADGGDPIVAGECAAGTSAAGDGTPLVAGDGAPPRPVTVRLGRPLH